jgi:hypothetical protein
VSKARAILSFLVVFVRRPYLVSKLIRQLVYVVRGLDFARTAQEPSAPALSVESRPIAAPANPLKIYFDSHLSGPGIWKWQHYFDIYHRYLQKHVGQDVHIVEIGVYSGGSLGMWRRYLGSRCHVHGVDVEAACKVYENEYTSIHIGDQADRLFWKKFKRQNPVIDIVIDDGGHLPEQQIVAMEELLPHLQPGGIYLVEDVHTEDNMFLSYLQGLARNLNACEREPVSDHGIGAPDTETNVCRATPLQGEVASIHLYPFVAVIEKNVAPVLQFADCRRGSSWQPFLG